MAMGGLAAFAETAVPADDTASFMLTRCQDDKDRRKFILHLTDKGRKLIAEVYPKNEEMIISEMGCWSDDEKEQMAAMLLKFRRK